MPSVALSPLERYRGQAGEKPGRIVERWLSWLGDGRPGDTTLARYLRHLAASNLVPGTVDLHYRTVRAFYRFQGLPAPTVRGWRYDPRDSRRPALTTGTVLAMIGAARDGRLTARQCSLLCLATVYGMRAGELAAVEQRDVDWDGDRIFVRTEKHGVQRWTWLPPGLRPWLQESWQPCEPAGVSALFAAIWEAVSERERPERTAWHSVRRALDRDLLAAGVPKDAIARFLRWASGGSGEGGSRFVDWYAEESVTVTLEGEAPAAPADTAARGYDDAAWSKHPYLRAWVEE